MKYPLACVFLACSAASAGADTAAAQRLTSLQEEFPFDRSGVEATAAPSEQNHDVVTMEAVTVTDSILRRQLVQSVNAKKKALQDEQFSWKKGGLLHSSQKGNRQVDLGIWPKLEHETLGTELAPMLRVKMLKIKW